MKKSILEIVKLEKFVPGGQSLGALSDGRKVFVWGALPGETARVEIYKLKKSYAEGIAVEILESSPQRIEPRDDCYISTSPWQILDYDYELVMKAELVVEAFRQEGIRLCHSGLDSESSKNTVIASKEVERSEIPHFGEAVVRGQSRLDRHVANAPRDDNMIITDNRDFFYRNKMEYSLWWQEYSDAAENLRQTFTKEEIARGGKIFLAFHKRGSHQKIPILHSSIERPEIFAAASRIVDELNSRGESAHKYQSLLVRCNQNGGVSSALFENNQPHPTMKNLTDDILGREYSYSPNGFFQINLPVYEMALTEIAKHLGDSKKVVDMYAGVGTIGLSVAQNRELTLVETDKNAFQELLNNCHSGLDSKSTISHDQNDKNKIRKEIQNEPLDSETSDAKHFPSQRRNSGNQESEALSQQLLARLSKDGKRVSAEPCNDRREKRSGEFVGEAAVECKGSSTQILGTSPRMTQSTCDDNITAIHAKSEEALDYITNDITLILDPPRAGLDEKVIARILDTKPPTVIYLSCNPTTQARDVAKLLPKYEITHQQAFNFFPRTPHIENLIVLKLK